MIEEDNDEKRSMEMLTMVIVLFVGFVVGFVVGYLAKAYIFN